MHLYAMNGLSRMTPSANDTMNWAMQGMEQWEQEYLMDGLSRLTAGETLNGHDAYLMQGLFTKLRARLRARKERRRKFKLERIAAQGERASKGGGVGGIFKGITEAAGKIFGRGGGGVPEPVYPPGGGAPEMSIATSPPKILGLTYPQLGLGAAGVGLLWYFTMGPGKKKKRA